MNFSKYFLKNFFELIYQAKTLINTQMAYNRGMIYEASYDY